jgi:hypothetical protein
MDIRVSKNDCRYSLEAVSTEIDIKQPDMVFPRIGSFEVILFWRKFASEEWNEALIFSKLCSMVWPDLIELTNHIAKILSGSNDWGESTRISRLNFVETAIRNETSMSSLLNSSKLQFTIVRLEDDVSKMEELILMLRSEIIDSMSAYNNVHGKYLLLRTTAQRQKRLVLKILAELMESRKYLMQSTLSFKKEIDDRQRELLLTRRELQKRRRELNRISKLMQAATKNKIKKPIQIPELKKPPNRAENEWGEWLREMERLGVFWQQEAVSPGDQGAEEGGELWELVPALHTLPARDGGEWEGWLRESERLVVFWQQEVVSVGGQGAEEGGELWELVPALHTLPARVGGEWGGWCFYLEYYLSVSVSLILEPVRWKSLDLELERCQVQVLAAAPAPLAVAAGGATRTLGDWEAWLLELEGLARFESVRPARECPVGPGRFESVRAGAGPDPSQPPPRPCACCCCVLQ